jgi:hypothetical protein
VYHWHLTFFTSTKVSGDTLFSPTTYHKVFRLHIIPISVSNSSRNHSWKIFKERKWDTGLLIVADELKNLSSIYRIDLHTFVKEVFPWVALVISGFTIYSRRDCANSFSPKNQFDDAIKLKYFIISTNFT